MRQLQAAQKVGIQVFGAFRIERETVPLDMERLGYSKPIELLKFLIAYSGRNLSVDFIISKLWTEADGDHAKNSFDGTLHRLRRILGSRDTLVLNSGVLSLNEKSCWLDLWEFEKLAVEIEEICRNGSGTLQALSELAGKLMSVVRGPCFWLASDLPWIYIIQEKTKARFLRLILVLGEAFENHDRFGDTTALYTTALEYYPLAEEVCLRLVQLRIRQGLYTEALMAFRQFSHVLAESLGMPPSKAMQQAIAAIKPARPQS